MNSLFPMPYNDKQRHYMIAIYVLYALGVFVGVSVLVGVIIAYVKRPEMQGTIYQDHLHFLIRTFWVSLVGLVLGVVLAVFGVGLLILIAVSIWFVFRVVVGAIRFIDDQPVTPTGWFM